MLFDEFGCQHQYFDAGFRTGQPVVRTSNLYKFDVFARALERVVHASALIRRDDRVVASVKEEHRTLKCVSESRG